MPSTCPATTRLTERGWRSSRELGGPDLDALAAITDAVEAGAGLPEILRAAARALDASLILIDRSAAVLAVAARSPADERSLDARRRGRHHDRAEGRGSPVGQLRMRTREHAPDGALLRLVTTLIASEVERVRAPERASEEAAASFQRAVLGGQIDDRADLIARGKELGTDLAAGASVLIVRAHARSPTEDDWRRRLLAVTGRGARSTAPGSIAAPAAEDSAEIVGARPRCRRRHRAAWVRRRSCASSSQGCPGSRSRSGAAGTRAIRSICGARATKRCWRRTSSRAIPSNPSSRTRRPGTYQLLLPYMSDPAELRRFYDETVRPLVAYDEQYETDLLGTLATFLECDANVNATAARLITHRHTIRYRFERVRELTGLDVQSTDGREKLSLGLKAMRVLGIARPRGPATEPGAEGGRVPR